MQMKLPFLDSPTFDAEIWEHLDKSKRILVLDKLAKLIAKTAWGETQQGENNHE